jgi:amino acid adenylation domain-containing protein
MNTSIQQEGAITGIRIARPSRPRRLSEENRTRILMKWNRAQMLLPTPCCIHLLFEEQVERTPQAPAVIFEGRSISYAELNRRANRLAHFLQDQGVEPETYVGIAMERSISMIVSLLAILKAGGAFLLLDPTLPRERMALMLEDSGVHLILTQKLETLTESLRLPNRTVLDVGTFFAQKHVQFLPTSDPVSGVNGGNTAYLISTSGTTGQPKAVRIRHEAIVNLHLAQRQTFGIRKEDRILQFSSMNFDACIFEVVMALLSGAQLVMAEHRHLQVGPPLLRLLREQRVTLAVLTPSVWAALPAEALPSLRIAMMAGEPTTAELVRKWSAPGRRVLNLYGPAEAAIWTTWSECLPSGGKPSIGRPIANTQIYILDKQMQPLDIGVPGQIYIGGMGLGSYHRRPHLNREKFPRSPFGHRGERLYATGDLGCWKPDGQIDFLGRVDHQIKIRGQRIELEEIERVLSSAPGVENCTVLYPRKRLIAYIVPQPGYQEANVRAFLAQRLTTAMMPSAFVILERLPLTLNGKLDSQALEKAAHDQQKQKVVSSAEESKGDPLEEDEHFAAFQERLRQIVADTLELPLDEVQPETNFFEAGGDSLSVGQLLSALEAHLRVHIDPRVVYTTPVLYDLAMALFRYVMQSQGEIR